MIRTMLVQRFRANARPMLWIYLLLIGVAEYVTAAVNPMIGLALHALVLVGLVFHAAFATEPAVRSLIGALTLAPLIRLLSLSLPLGSLRQVFWYPVVAMPLLLATFLLIWQSRMPRVMLGLRRGKLPLQLMVMAGGAGLGALEYAILQPAPLIRPFGWVEVAAAGLILLIFTGFTEELIFRGVLQSFAIPVLGRWSLFYVALLFAVLHIGYLSLLDVIFVFAVGLLFAYIVFWSGSLLGVTLAHGLTNIFLFLVMPYAAENLPAQLTQVLPWLIGVTSALSIGAISVMGWRAYNAGRFNVGRTFVEAPVRPVPGKPRKIRRSSGVRREPTQTPPTVSAARDTSAEDLRRTLYERLSGDTTPPLLQVDVEDEELRVRAVLFVPAHRLAHADRIEVFGQGATLSDGSIHLLPPQYGFIAGVVELDALPLEAHDARAHALVLHRVGRLLAKRLRIELDALAEQQPEAFQQFWTEHGGYFGIGPWAPQLHTPPATLPLSTAPQGGV